MQQLAAQHFRGLGIVLPIDWEAPDTHEKSDQYAASFEEGDRSGHNPSAMCLFQAATTNKLHADTANEISDKIGAYMDGVCAAICSSALKPLTAS